MELNIQDLVSSIKRDGVEAARKEADGILADARKQAEAIIAQAKTEAAAAKESASKEIELLRSSAITSTEQAKRDAMLSFKAEVKSEYEKILASKVKDTMSGNALAGLIQAAIADEDPSKYAAEVAQVTDELKAGLADKIRAGLEIRPSRSVRAGFRLSSKDGSGYFDCTDEQIAEMLMPFFNSLTI